MARTLPRYGAVIREAIQGHAQFKRELPRSLFRNRLGDGVRLTSASSSDPRPGDRKADVDTCAAGALPRPRGDGPGTVLVSSVMTRDAEVVEPSTPVGDVSEVFAQLAIRHLPVVNGEQIVGLISCSDGQRLGTMLTLARALGKLCARDIMWGRTVVVREDSTLAEAAAVLCVVDFHALPVVDADRRLCGIVTSTDPLCLLADSDD